MPQPIKTMIEVAENSNQPNAVHIPDASRIGKASYKVIRRNMVEAELLLHEPVGAAQSSSLLEVAMPC